MPTAKRDPDTAPDSHEAELAKSRERRRRAGLRAGLTDPEAELFADGDTTLKTLRHCLSRGATPAEIASIVV